jgi:hypothetical protein
VFFVGRTDSQLLPRKTYRTPPERNGGCSLPVEPTVNSCRAKLTERHPNDMGGVLPFYSDSKNTELAKSKPCAMTSISAFYERIMPQ